MGNHEIQNYETFGLSESEEEEEGRSYKSFFIISLFTFFISAFLGFYFTEKPITLWGWDDPFSHLIPFSMATIWTGIVFLSVSPVQKALDIILSGFFAIFIWYKLFSNL